jgi:hypothetical protein
VFDGCEKVAEEHKGETIMSGKGRQLGSAKIQKVYYILYNTLTILGHFNSVINHAFISLLFWFAT